MIVERTLVREFAMQLAEKVVRKAIAYFQSLDATLSGENSGLLSVWDEICVQLQFEESHYWFAYESIISSAMRSFIGELKTPEKVALSLQTPAGWEWCYDNEDKSYKSFPICDDDIVEFVVSEVLFEKARNWSNSRIRQYIETGYELT